jgi:hypothetical protein
LEAVADREIVRRIAAQPRALVTNDVLDFQLILSRRRAEKPSQTPCCESSSSTSLKPDDPISRGCAAMNAPVAVRANDAAVEAEDVLAEAVPLHDYCVIGADHSPGLAASDPLCRNAPAVEGGDVAAGVKAGTQRSAGGGRCSEDRDDDDQRQTSEDARAPGTRKDLSHLAILSDFRRR